MTLRQQFIDDLRLHNYAPRTIQAYVRAVACFARCPSRAGSADLRDFQLDMIRQQLSFGHFNVRVCALKVFYTLTLQRPDFVQQLPYARRRKHLPTILSTDEVARLLAAADPGRERPLLQTAYALGLRVGELVQIQVSDIDSSRHLLRVHGKGGKERLVPFTPELLQQWRHYWRTCRRPSPLPWLFLNGNADGPIAIQRVQAICTKIVRRSGLRKRISMHTLRHCGGFSLKSDAWT